MNKPRLMLFVVLAFFSLGSCEDSRLQRRIKSVQYYSKVSADFEGERLFDYDDDGRIISITEKWGSVQVRQITYDDNLLTVTEDDKIRHYFMFNGEYLMQYVMSQTFTTGTTRNDTVNFVYESGNLQTISYGSEVLTVMTEDNGNIVSTTAVPNEIYSYDNYPNPFRKIPVNFLTYVADEAKPRSLSSLDLLRYFSKNNPMHPRITQYGYAGSEVYRIVSYPAYYCISDCQIVEKITYSLVSEGE